MRPKAEKRFSCPSRTGLFGQRGKVTYLRVGQVHVCCDADLSNDILLHVRSAQKRAAQFLNVAKNKSAPAAGLSERFEIYWPRLADLRAQETAVIFYPYSAAAEQISNGSDGFAATFGARANCEDKIA